MSIRNHTGLLVGILGPACAGMQMTKEEFLAHDEWEVGPRYELIRGVLIVSPAVSGAERYPNDELGRLLRNYQDAHPGIIDDTAYECDVRTSNGIRRVDRAIFMNLGRAPKAIGDVPAIIIEFVSYGRRNAERDYIEKRGEFLALGVQEYWVFDRFDRTLCVFTGTVADPRSRVVTAVENYTTPLLPGFVLPLKKIFEIADRHADS
jgi:Uma2 family endonuclease